MMADYINTLSSLLGVSVPAWGLLAVPAVLILLVIIIILYVQTKIFKRRLRKVINFQDEQQTAEAIRIFQTHYPAEKLVRYSRRMERYSRQMGPKVVRETGLADKWVEKLGFLPRAADIRRVLLYCESSAVFKAFLAAGKSERLREVFTNWMHSQGDEKVIRLLAELCRGEDFDPAFGKTFLKDNSALIRELAGEPEWYARFFAYRILLNEKDALAERCIEDGLPDPHYLVRKILLENISFEKDKTWALVWDKLIHDPVYEIREAARKRIKNEFLDRYSPKTETLNEVEAVHVLELLDPDCQEDRAFALASLESSNKALRYPAAAFLEKCGVLAPLLAKNTFDDPGTMEHSAVLLKNAMEVNVSGFLREYPSGDGAPLLVASRLLKTDSVSAKPEGKAGPVVLFPSNMPEYVSILENKVFAFFSGRKPDPTSSEIYTNTLKAVANYGNTKSFEILADELSRRGSDKVFLDLLLPGIPNKAGTVFSAILFRFLEDVAFPAREELEKALGSFPADIILLELFHILNTGRCEYPHAVRVSALMILGHLRLPFCLQRILESLPILTPDEIEKFGRIIADYPSEVFEEKVSALFASPDAQIRASVITILPITKNENFLKQIRSSLKDVDPDVRVAAIKALLGFGEIRLLNQETSMLHDPVERVRIATAEVIAAHGNTAAMEILKTITTDPNETDVVKISVIDGLGMSESEEGITILVGVLDSGEFREHAEKALAMRVRRRDIMQLVNIFKDAEPQLRERLIPVFKAQGKKAEPQIVEILKNEVESFKPYLVNILEETGFIEEAKKRLLNRNAEVRREAALLLSLMDTLPAFRGLVLAAKDPDQEVRVCVVKALEKLQSDQSHDMLEKLKADPDNRIRKYTFWALERLDSLKME